jgi:hypothetical protein
MHHLSGPDSPVMKYKVIFLLLSVLISAMAAFITVMGIWI